MNVVVIIKTLLQLVSFFIRKADEAQLKELGKNELVQQQLTELVKSTGVAKAVAQEIAGMSDDAIDEFLRNHYRD